MMKKLLPITAILLFVMATTAIAQMKIGYMNTQEVLNQLPERERVEKELQTFIADKQNQLSKRAKAYQDAVAEFQSDQSETDMTQQEIETRKQELLEMQTSLDEFDQNLRDQIQQKRQELLSPILDRVDKAIAAVAQSEGLDFVLNEATNAGNPLVFYASANQINITDQVVSELTSNSN